MSNITDLGNGDGFIYTTEVDGTTIIKNTPNTTEGREGIQKDGYGRSPLSNGTDARGTFSIDTAPTVSQSYTAVNINGVNQLSATVVSTGDAEIDVSNIIANINSHMAASGPDYSGSAFEEVGTIIAPPGEGDSVNGQSITIVHDTGATITTTDLD